VGRVGKHPIYPSLRQAASELGYTWEAKTFIDHCTDGKNPKLCKTIQLLEWQLLFDYCMKGQQ
jgi:hypothetical protein